MAEIKLKQNDKVVYPTHGVGTVVGIEAQAIAGTEVKLVAVMFEKDKMTLRIPLIRAEQSGLRKLSSQSELDKVRSTLKGRAKTSRGMWSRRAKEYESKINSGNIVSLAEVVRDLHKNVDDPDRSYSERVIYENALNRLAGEFAAVENIDLIQATTKLVKTMKVTGSVAAAA
ncbi:MAG: CarD family transcriptional regulator [Proteobacteria bacterium]|nr:CarD family transcriptional regulator [Pseudomonadota bacterium]